MRFSHVLLSSTVRELLEKFMSNKATAAATTPAMVLIIAGLCVLDLILLLCQLLIFLCKLVF